MFCNVGGKKNEILHSVKIPDRNGATMANAVIKALSAFPKGAVKTITCDRKSEFVEWRKIEELYCSMYSADPYCIWPKGMNENLNGLFRKFYPKGRNLERVSEKTLKKDLALTNARQKKVLHYQKPVDLFNFFLAKCCTWFDNSPFQFLLSKYFFLN